jgi:hypothetical protein
LLFLIYCFIYFSLLLLKLLTIKDSLCLIFVYALLSIECFLSCFLDGYSLCLYFINLYYFIYILFQCVILCVWDLFCSSSPLILMINLINIYCSLSSLNPTISWACDSKISSPTLMMNLINNNFWDLPYFRHCYLIILILCSIKNSLPWNINNLLYFFFYFHYFTMLFMLYVFLIDFIRHIDFPIQ